MRAVAVIPARFASTRLPGKPLLLAGGRTLIEHVWARVREARSLDAVVVATDDERIAQVVRAFGGDARMTLPSHPTGSDRIGELLPHLDAEIVLNVQGDEPDIAPALIDRLVQRLRDDRELGCCTAACPFPDGGPVADPTRAKVVPAVRSRALYFSRAAIPANKPGDPGPLDSDPWPLLHLGIYAYRREVLQAFLTWPRGRLERIESLEQLRPLENGTSIGVDLCGEAPHGIDTPSDFAAFRAKWEGFRP